MWRLLYLLLAAVIVSPVAADSLTLPRPVEGRAIWIDGASIPNNDQAMAAMVDSYSKANLNILIPEVLYHGYTIYPSKLDKQNDKWSGYDPLAAMIREAHTRGMEVHAWVPVFRQGYTQDKGPILTAHPDWIAENKWGETLSANGGYWICPSIPEARNYLQSLFKEIALNYDIDGLHLDYIRFENQFPSPYCYNKSCRDKFKCEYGIDPMDIDPLTEQQVTWHLWRENLVNTFVQEVSSDIKKIKPQVKISAAVGSFPDTARVSLLQNWPNWVDNKWLDFITPMAYTNDTDTFTKMLTSEHEALGNKTIILPGIGLHTQKDSAVILGQIGIVRDGEFDGVTLFSSSHVKQPVLDALAAGPFSDKAQIPFRDPGKCLETLLDDAIDTVYTNPDAYVSYLKYAAQMLRYLAYQASKTGYIAPTRPPIYIPETIIPLPSAEVPSTDTPPTLDGVPNESMWRNAGHISITYTEFGNPAPVATDVMLAYDSANLYIAYNATEPNMSALKSTVTKRDGPVFYDDSFEFFIDPWNKRRDYYQLAINSLGTQFDAKVNNSGVNLNWQDAAAMNPTGWSAEIAIPFASLGVEPPKSGTTWAMNFARNRWVTGSPEYLIWSVPYGSFNQPSRFGTVVFK